VNRKSDLDIQDVWKREGLVQVTKENDGRNPEQHLHDMFFCKNLTKNMSMLVEIYCTKLNLQQEFSNH